MNVVYSEARIPVGGGGDLQPFVSAIMDSKPDIVWELLGAEVLGRHVRPESCGLHGCDGQLGVLLARAVQEVPVGCDTLDGALIQASTPVSSREVPR